MTQEIQNIVVDGIEYAITNFSKEVQHLARINALWQEELNRQRLEVTKTEAALRQLNVEITQHVTKELEEKRNAAQANAQAAAQAAEYAAGQRDA